MSWTPHILYEDNHYIAISKPSGLAVQADESDAGDAIIPILQEFVGKRDKKPGKAFIGVLHRLDKPVTGVLVLAKTSKGQERFNELLKNKKVAKYYLAITEKKKIAMDGVLRNFFSRKDEEYRMSVSDVKRSEFDQEAILRYRIIGMTDGEACWAIELITGRRHQIRAQLAHLECPIIGDKRYGSKVDHKSLALHCACMRFIHPIKNIPVIIKDNPDSRESIWKNFKSKTEEWLAGFN